MLFRKFFGFLSFFAVCLTYVSSAAIPMWEFLSRNEKMNYLFKSFSKQVAEYCYTSSMPDCNKVLLIYGYTNLAKIDDDSLDKMDPYQRGANDIIWESVMKGSYMKQSYNPRDTEHDYYADALEPNNDENHLGSSSNKLEDVVSPQDKYVIGPMVVRVLPDGSPVPGDNARPLPKDEDAEEYKAMRPVQISSIYNSNPSKNHDRTSYTVSAVDKLIHE